MPPVIVRGISDTTRVRFDSVDNNDDSCRISRQRIKESVAEVRKRAQSAPGLRQHVSTVDCRDLYQVTQVDQNGGTLRSVFYRGRQTFFDVKFTQFNGASFDVERVDGLICENDYILVLQRYPYYGRGGKMEWRAKDIRFPNPSDPEFLQRNINDDGDPIWVVHGRILHNTMHSKVHQDIIVSTGIEDCNIFATKESCSGDASKFEKNVTVLVRAEKRSGARRQAANFQWYGMNVQIVGELKEGTGVLKQIPYGDRRRSYPFVIIANGFGYVLLPSESQRLCTKTLADGVRVSFVACSNLPCPKAGSKNLYSWRAVNVTGTVEVPKKVEDQNQSKEEKQTPKEETMATVQQVQILPPIMAFSNVSVATSCYTCQGELVCLCYS